MILAPTEEEPPALGPAGAHGPSRVGPGARGRRVGRAHRSSRRRRIQRMHDEELAPSNGQPSLPAQLTQFSEARSSSPAAQPARAPQIQLAAGPAGRMQGTGCPGQGPEGLARAQVGSYYTGRLRFKPLPGARGTRSRSPAAPVWDRQSEAARSPLPALRGPREHGDSPQAGWDPLQGANRVQGLGKGSVPVPAHAPAGAAASRSAPRAWPRAPRHLSPGHGSMRGP